MNALVRMLSLLAVVALPAISIAQVGLVTLDTGPDSFSDYAWLGEVGEETSLKPLNQVFPTPDGHSRIGQSADSFGQWLRRLPVRLDREHVLARTGQRLNSPSAAVVYLDVLKYQQCADSAIRLHAEWLWFSGRSDEIAYHFTSGDESTWEAWRNGERFRVSGTSVDRVFNGVQSGKRSNLIAYLEHLFTYAGTRSLRFDSTAVEPRFARAGDFFVAPGSPGHAVVILDIIVAKDGTRHALIGQGFMPTQEFHVVEDRRALNGVWFELPEGPTDTIKTPSWRAFRGEDLRRFDGS